VLVESATRENCVAAASAETWHYRLHGLTLSSAFPLYQVDAVPPPPSAESDVVIRMGDVPERLGPTATVGFRWEVTPGAALMDVANIARILITSREIVLSPKPTATLQELSFGVLAAAMPPLLFLRRTLVLHAAAVRVADRAIAIAGTSGVGKSTALFACLSRGARLVTDDVAAVRFSDAEAAIAVHPGAPIVKLWPDALGHYGVSDDHSEPIRPAATKRQVTAPVAQDAIPLAALVILEAHLGAMQCRQVNGRAAFNAVRSQMHGPRMVLAIDRETAFRQVARVANQVPTFVLQRPDDLTAMERIADLILAVAP